MGMVKHVFIPGKMLKQTLESSTEWSRENLYCLGLIGSDGWWR
jgi:hypothetical protein